MKRQWSFEEARAAWSRGKGAADPSVAVYRAYVSAEAFLLRARPTRPVEAALMISVLLDQDGERTDGLDRTALLSLLAYVEGNEPARQAA